MNLAYYKCQIKHNYVSFKIFTFVYSSKAFEIEK